MAVQIKKADDIDKMRVAGRLAAEVLEMIVPYVVPGITTGEINRICHDYITIKQNAIPAPLNYNGFPASVCISTNEVICHGIPSDKQFLCDGDIVNVDITVIKDGFHGDTSRMFLIGNVSSDAQKLVKITLECLYKGIEIIKPGISLGDVGSVIQKHAHANNFSVVREYCGHGIGRNFHEDPQVLHYGKKNTGIKLREGMTFTIEPMINAGQRHITISKQDGWTVSTKDKKLSAQWEHTLLVTKSGCDVLTKRNDEILF